MGGLECQIVTSRAKLLNLVCPAKILIPSNSGLGVWVPRCLGTVWPLYFHLVAFLFILMNLIFCVGKDEQVHYRAVLLKWW